MLPIKYKALGFFCFLFSSEIIATDNWIEYKKSVSLPMEHIVTLQDKTLSLEPNKIFVLNDDTLLVFVKKFQPLQGSLHGNFIGASLYAINDNKVKEVSLGSEHSSFLDVLEMDGKIYVVSQDKAGANHLLSMTFDLEIKKTISLPKLETERVKILPSGGGVSVLSLLGRRFLSFHYDAQLNFVSKHKFYVETDITNFTASKRSGELYFISNSGKRGILDVGLINKELTNSKMIGSLQADQAYIFSTSVSNNHLIITSKFIGEEKYAVSVVPVAGKNLLKRKYLYEKDIFPVMPTFSAKKDGAFLLDNGFREIIFSKLDINNFNSSTYALPEKISNANAVRSFPVCNRKVCYIVTSAFTLKGNNNLAFDQVLVHAIQ